MKEIIKEKEYVHDGEKKEYASKGVGNAALATGIIGTALGAAAIWGRGRGFGFGGSMPENVNINTVSDAIAGRSGSSPTAFGAYSHSCEAQLALTNEMWGLKVNTLNQMYAHRDTDVSEKFAFNGFYADTCAVLDDEQVIKTAHKFYFGDEDAPQGKIWLYMECMYEGN